MVLFMLRFSPPNPFPLSAAGNPVMVMGLSFDRPLSRIRHAHHPTGPVAFTAGRELKLGVMSLRIVLGQHVTSTDHRRKLGAEAWQPSTGKAPEWEHGMAEASTSNPTARATALLELRVMLIPEG